MRCKENIKTFGANKNWNALLRSDQCKYFIVHDDKNKSKHMQVQAYTFLYKYGHIYTYILTYIWNEHVPSIHTKLF